MPEPTWTPALFAERAGRAWRCTLCAHACTLEEGSVGQCRVRRVLGDRLETATFATSTWHVQGVERKPLYHVSPGLRLLTLAAPGCSMRCTYCQNFPLSQYGRGPLPWSATPVTPAEVLARVPAGGGVAFSYSEPSLAVELALALADAAPGLPLVWKSNGLFTRACREAVAPSLLAVNLDLKAHEEGAHRRLTGAELAPVLDNIAGLRQLGVWVEVSTPLITGFNDHEIAIRAMARRLAAVSPDLPWHLLRVHPDHVLQNIAPTAPPTLSRARAIAAAEGLRFVYVERALGVEGRRTRCASCGTLVIDRPAPWGPGLGDGRCTTCQTTIPGSWAAPSACTWPISPT